jgi:hypothetical protein
MSSSICSSNLTSGFIDLATYDEQEKYMYGGPNATAYFVRDIRLATWFTQVPVVLTKNGNTNFGGEWYANITRAGDYLLYAWLRVVVPAVALSDTVSDDVVGIRWTRNLFHNLLVQACVTFNDLVAMKIDNWFLDFWSAFTTVASKLNGYNNMIGKVDALINTDTSLPSYVLNLPLPLFFARDSGVSLPTAALPYNDMKLQFHFNEWQNLLIVDLTDQTSRPATSADLAAVPQLSNVNCWANYAIVSSAERKKMGCAPRDILIEQVQTAPIQAFSPLSNPSPSYDIRFSHAIKLLFFSVVNTTNLADRSNYSAALPVPPAVLPGIVNFSPSGAADPIDNTSLFYENTQRLANMGSDYFSLVQPWYHAPAIPFETGYHMYSYSLSFFEIDPMGSTNYGKLTNISIMPVASAAAITGATGGQAVATGQLLPQRFSFIPQGINNNIIRVSGGALGFPVL